jgi:crossover junction endodeoxyribonuclease RuvC
MRVLGGDPSIAHLGLGLIERTGPELPRVLLAETIHTDTKAPIHERMGVLFDRVGEIVRQYHPDALALEEQRGVQVGKWQREEGFNADNSKTHYAVATVICAARAYGCTEVVWFTPQQIKIAVLGKGGGRGSKDAVKDAIRPYLLAAGIKRFSEHAADAVAGAITGERKLHWNVLQHQQQGRKRA